MEVLMMLVRRADRRPDHKPDLIVVGRRYRYPATPWFLCGYYAATGIALFDAIHTNSLTGWVERAANGGSLIDEHTIELEALCDDHPPFLVEDCCRRTLRTAVIRATGIPVDPLTLHGRE